MYSFFTPLDGDENILTRLKEKEKRETEVSVVKTIFTFFSTKKLKTRCKSDLI